MPLLQAIRALLPVTAIHAVMLCVYVLSVFVSSRNRIRRPLGVGLVVTLVTGSVLVALVEARVTRDRALREVRLDATLTVLGGLVPLAVATLGWRAGATSTAPTRRAAVALGLGSLALSTGTLASEALACAVGFGSMSAAGSPAHTFLT